MDNYEDYSADNIDSRNNDTTDNAESSSEDVIPKQMRDFPRWVLWRFEKRHEKRTKVPYRSSILTPAKTSDPNTWSDYATCLTAFASGTCEGIGFVFAGEDGLVGIDLDHCITNDKIDPWAQEILDHFSNTYIEITPSGEGFHIITRGKIPRGFQKKWKHAETGIEQGIELYESRRFFTVTGESINCKEVQNCQHALDKLTEKYSSPCRVREMQSRSSHRSNRSNISASVLDAALKAIPPDDYRVWRDVGMALKFEGFDFEIWDEWSKKSLKYVPGECADLWERFAGPEDENV